MRIVAISDTHNRAEKIPIPDGDVLVHAGDLTMQGTHDELLQSARWLDGLKSRFERILVIPGNHDFGIQDNTLAAKQMFSAFDLDLLIDERVVIDGIKFYGSPWQPWFHNWAFNFPEYDRGEAQAKWAEIPDDTDVLIAHGPPFGILDKVLEGGDTRVGCRYLRDRIAHLSLQAHAFGHMHESFGTEKHDGTLFVNAAICDRRKYAAIQPPVSFEVHPLSVK